MNQDFINDVRYQYYQYVVSPKFAGFIDKQYGSLGWRRLIAQYFISRDIKRQKMVNEELAKHGQLVLGSVVIANTMLPELQVAPALILGTFDTSLEGYIELLRVQSAIWSAEESGDQEVINAVDSIYADIDFEKWRRRAVPAALTASPSMFFFDQMIRRDDMSTIRYATDAGANDFPIVTMFASAPDENHASEAIPQPISKSIVARHYHENDLGSCGLHIIDNSYLIEPNTIEKPWLTKTKLIIGIVIILGIIGAIAD